MNHASNRSLRVAFQTFGCRLNQSDTEGLRAALDQEHELVAFAERADLYVINSCSITHNAEADVRRAVRRAREHGGEAARIIVTGCYAQRAAAEVAALPGVDGVIGNDRKADLAGLVAVIEPGWRTASVGDMSVVDQIPEYPLPLTGGRTRAYLQVQDGCEDGCAFCVVPETRGRFRSLPIERAVTRLSQLEAAGFREIVLTGANLSSYGAEEASAPKLHDLLEALLAVEGEYRLRLSSFEPSDLTSQLIDLINRSERICRHLHVPVQSLDDGVLRRMGRSYDAQTAARIVRELAAAVPDIAIGTDLMVGFPGEDDEAFLTTLHTVESLPFTYFHVFAYSARPGTAAASMRDDVPREEKKRRSRLLREVGTRKAIRFAQGQVGNRARVLVERPDSSGHYMRGYTDNYQRVTVPANGSETNRFIDLILRPEHLDALRRAPAPAMNG